MRLLPDDALPDVGALVVSGTLVRLDAGATLMRQHEAGDACYVIRDGRVAVQLDAEAAEDAPAAPRVLATLTAGALVGEGALLTGAGRSATVLALENSSLVRIEARDFLDLLTSNREAAAAVLGQWRLRARPRQVAGVAVLRQQGASADSVVVLKHPRTGAYFRLSALGWFVWERLDGHHTVADLTLGYWEAHRQLAPQLVAEVVAGLGAAGFTETAGQVLDGEARFARGTAGERRLLAAHRLLDLSLPLARPNALVERVYRAGGFLFCGPLGVAFLLAMALGGAVSWLLSDVSASSPNALSPLTLLWLIPLRLVTVVVHELAHGLAARAAGCDVRAAGIGLYWLTPVAWVDTSDTWLASRRARIGVGLAGILADLAIGGLAGLLSTVVHEPMVRGMLLQATLLSYGSAVANLCPAMKFDGYYVLSDLLDRPNLRQQALTFLGRDVLAALRMPRLLWARRIELGYAVVSLVYVLALLPVTAWTVEAALEVFAGSAMSAAWVGGLAWSLSALTTVAIGLGIAGELRAARFVEAGMAR